VLLSDMLRANYPSLEDFFNAKAMEFLDKCVSCGECLRNCPMPPVVLGDVTPGKIMEKTARFLKYGEDSKEVYLKAFGCTLCGECSRSCLQGIDVVEVFGKVRSEYFKRGEIPDAIKQRETAPTYNPRTISAMLMKPSERRWMDAWSIKPSQTENLVFLGCTLLFHPHFTLPWLDILENMKVDFIAIGGGPIEKGRGLCCGFPYYLSGNTKMFDKTAEDLISIFKRFNPKRVILTCSACYHFINKIYKKLEPLKIDFEVKYCGQFLLENVDKLEFKKSVNKKVYFQPSCGNRKANVDDVLHKLLGKIPGLTVIKGPYLCCGGTPKVAFPEVFAKTVPVFREFLTKRVIENECDLLTMGCQQCALAFSPYLVEGQPFTIESIFGIINEAMGGKKYENRWLKYWKCKSEDEIIEVSREYFKANGLTEEEARKTLAYILSWR